jgi:hypothetical protein
MPPSGCPLPRLGVLLLAWAAGGFLTCAQMCAVGRMVPRVGRAAALHGFCHAVAVILLFAGGAMVRGGGGGYTPCANNVTMDYPCMLEQGAGYLWPYILHFIGGSYFIAGWLLDGCHLISWAGQIEAFLDDARENVEADTPNAQNVMGVSEKLHPMTIFLTPQSRESGSSISFDSKWHLISKATLVLLIIATWTTGLVQWSTEPALSTAVHPGQHFVSLGSLLLIFAAEAALAFSLAAAGLKAARARAAAR